MDHAFAIDVTDFQVLSIQRVVLRWRRASSTECDDKESELRLESRDFFLAEDRRKAKRFFRIGRLGDAPGFLEF